MNTTTPTKPNFSTEDLVLNDMIVSDVNTFMSKKDKPLITIKLVGSKKFKATPSIFYFGSQSYEELQELQGQKVDVLLGCGDTSFNIQDIKAK